MIDRHHTGRGKWFALVQAIKSPVDSEFGRIEVLASAECETRPEALSKARELLAEHAAKIGEDTLIEGKVICELDDEAEGLRQA
jgi:hypothetical protein